MPETPMSDILVILDRHRSEAQRLRVMLRRDAIRASRSAASDALPSTRDRLLHRQLLAPPAAHWEEVAERAEFLLARLASSQGRHEREIETLLRRLLLDVTRLARAGAALREDQPCD